MPAIAVPSALTAQPMVSPSSRNFQSPWLI